MPSPTPGRQLVVTMTVRGQIQPQDSPMPYYYYCLINRTDTIGDPGPAPVVDRPWGNGFAAASQPNAQGFVAFVLYDRFQGQGSYVVNSLEINGQLQNPALNSFFSLGQPDFSVTPQTGERTLQFRLNLNRIPIPNARYIQINFVATNFVPQGVDDAPKVWDALGDGATTGSLNSFVTLDTSQNIIRTNRETNLEPANDVRDHLGPLVDDANLDITDWTIEIRGN